jgi:hypothetical protein
MAVYVVALFVALTPGVLLSLPPKGSKMVVVATHAVVFAVVLSVTCKAVWRMTQSMQGFQDVPEEEEEDYE